MWSKVSVHRESAQVPLIICVPGKNPAVCHSFAELLDLYPTVSQLCGLKVPDNIQGKDISPLLDDPAVKVRDVVLCSGKGRLLRTEKWAFLDYGKDGELYDMEKDPRQYDNLIDDPAYAETLADLRAKLKAKLSEIGKNDLSPEQ
jgi:arylsulfatase A-like enzyme